MLLEALGSGYSKSRKTLKIILNIPRLPPIMLSMQETTNILLFLVRWLIPAYALVLKDCLNDTHSYFMLSILE